MSVYKYKRRKNSKQSYLVINHLFQMENYFADIKLFVLIIRNYHYQFFKQAFSIFD